MATMIAQVPPTAATVVLPYAGDARWEKVEIDDDVL